MRIPDKLFMRREIINVISDTCGIKPYRFVISYRLFVNL